MTSDTGNPKIFAMRVALNANLDDRALRKIEM